MQASNERISRLIFKLLQQQASIAEQAELEAWKQRSPEHAVFIEKMLAEGFVSQGLRELALARQKSSERLAIQNIPLSDGSSVEPAVELVADPVADRADPVPGQVHYLSRNRVRYAAAIILMLGIGAAVWYGLSRSGREDVATGRVGHPQDILPGSDKAVLTLADGSRIVLDSAANGDVALQGNTKIVKSGSGQLAYQSGNAPAAARQMDIPPDGRNYNTVSTPRGGQYQIVLPDGSRVWLNAASTIRFPTQFAGETRTVEMTGEAYMEIAKNARQSFSVKVNGMEIQVLGTSFNINAYSDESAMKTTLIEGSVRVKAARKDAVLRAGQQAQVSRQIVHVIDNADVEKVVAWKNGLFNFNGAGVGEVMRQLARWYDIDVVYDKNIPNIEFVGKISRHVSLSGVLKGLDGAGLHFRIEEKKRLVIFP